MKKELEKLSIPCELILDSAVATVMQKIDIVLCEAEGIVANGGILNKVWHFHNTTHYLPATSTTDRNIPSFSNCQSIPKAFLCCSGKL